MRRVWWKPANREKQIILLHQQAQIDVVKINKVPMTAAGYSTLEDELKHLIRAERTRLIQRIRETIADDSNLAENSEYQAAKAEQEINEARIVELQDKLARAEVIDVSKLSGDKVKFGATVTLIDEETGERKTWQIVGEPEADARPFSHRAFVDWATEGCHC